MSMDSSAAYIPGVLGQLRDYYMATASPGIAEYGLAVTLAVGAVACGRRWFMPRQYGGGGTGLYIMAIGEAGTGKESVKSILFESLRSAGIEQCVYRGWTSPGAMALSVRESPNLIGIIDEVSHVLQAASGRNCDYNLSQLMGSILELYSVKSAWSPRSYSKGSKEDFSFVVDRPTLSLCAMSTSRRLAKVLTEDSVEDGLVPRFLIFRGPDSRHGLPCMFDSSREGADVNFPPAVASWIKQVSAPDNSEYSHNRISQTVRGVSAEAKDIFRALHKECVAKSEKSHLLGGLSARAVENAARLSLIFSVSMDAFSPSVEICGEAALAASDIVRWCVDNAEVFLQEIGQESEWAQGMRRVEAHILNAGNTGCTYSDLVRGCRAFRNVSGKQLRMRLLSDLLESGDVREDNYDNGRGRRATIYIHSSSVE